MGENRGKKEEDKDEKKKRERNEDWRCAISHLTESESESAGDLGVKERGR